MGAPRAVRTGLPAAHAGNAAPCCASSPAASQSLSTLRPVGPSLVSPLLAPGATSTAPKKAVILAQVGHFCFGAVGQYYSGADTRANSAMQSDRRWTSSPWTRATLGATQVQRAAGSQTRRAHHTIVFDCDVPSAHDQWRNLPLPLRALNDQRPASDEGRIQSREASGAAGQLCLKPIRAPTGRE